MNEAPSGTVGDALLASLADHADYIFANTGTDHPSLIEAYARAEAEGLPAPIAMAVPHENLAACMAYGHTMISGRPQAVLVHVGVGTANALIGLLDARRERVPMLLMAGRTPILESGARGARTRYIHWGQELFDQAGMVREAVKWDYELRRPEQLEDTIARAFSIATSAPAGPVYLTLPREVLAGPASGNTRSWPQALATPPAPDPAALEAAARILAAAERPLVVTASVGRDPAAVPALADLAERCALPVVSFFSRNLCFAATHAMHLGYEPGPLLAEADTVPVLECDVPWIPSLQGPPDDAKIIHLGLDPLFGDYPTRGFRTDLEITANPATALPQLADAMAAHAGTTRIDERRTRLAAVRDALRASWQADLERQSESRPIHPAWLSHCLEQARDDDAIVINEVGLLPQYLNMTRPGSYFSPSPAGGLGWGLGAALGAKLAAPEREVIAAVGDGSYMFGNPTPAHYISRAHDLPVLFVVANNSGWGAVRAATRAMYPGGVALKRNQVPLTALEPSPD